MGFLSLAQQAPWLLQQPWWGQQQQQDQGAAMHPMLNQQAQQAPPMNWPTAQPQPAQQPRQAQPQRMAAQPATLNPMQHFDASPAAPMQAAPDARHSWSSRIEEALERPLLQTGVALMAAAQPGGGGWGGALQGTMAVQQQHQQRQRWHRQEERDTQQWSWAQQEREQTVERRRLAQEYIRSRPTDEQAELRMIDPDQLGGYIQDSRRMEMQQRALDLQVEEMQYNNRYRNASLSMDARRLEQDRLLNSAETLLGRGEAERINGQMARLENWRMVENDLGALSEILERNPAAFDQILDGDQAVVLARIRDPQMRRDVNTIYSISANLAREELRGQTPVSNVDFLSAMRSNPNTQSGHLFARDWLSRAYEDRRTLEHQVQSALTWRQGGQDGPRSLYTADPQTGRNWYQGNDGYTYYTGGAGAQRGQSGPPSPGVSSADQRGAAEALAARRAARPTGGGDAQRQASRAIPPLMAEARMSSMQRHAYRRYSRMLEVNANPEAIRRAEEAARRVGVIP